MGVQALVSACQRDDPFAQCLDCGAGRVRNEDWCRSCALSTAQWTLSLVSIAQAASLAQSALIRRTSLGTQSPSIASRRQRCQPDSLCFLLVRALDVGLAHLPNLLRDSQYEVSQKPCVTIMPAPVTCRKPSVCSSQKRSFTSNLIQMRNWTSSQHVALNQVQDQGQKTWRYPQSVTQPEVVIWLDPPYHRSSKNEPTFTNPRGKTKDQSSCSRTREGWLHCFRPRPVIVGRGLLAHAFEPYLGTDPDIAVFASGVSNSMELRDQEFAREEALLKKTLAVHARRFIYFGSCGVATAEADLTPYMKHKKRMEALVLAEPGGLVLRLPQVVGRTENHHTLTNFLRDQISSGEHFTVWSHAERNLIDIDDIAAIGAALAVEMTEESSVVSIAAEKSLPMLEIVEIFERVLGKRANYSLVEKGATMKIDTSRIREVSARLGIHLGDGYVEEVVMKYYAPSDGTSSGHLRSLSTPSPPVPP